MKQTLGKKERLKSKTLIGQLYTQGKSVKAFPLRMVYIQTNHSSNFPVQAGFSVPKRNFKKAVDRNRLKRLLRETYRKDKFIVYTELAKPYVFMISFIGKEALPYSEIEIKMKKLLNSFVNDVKNNSLNESNKD
ncbi:ribonuclease P protein component [Polaribacter pacificus]|uniref:Ribonuclease P protein component n=1 Tax=Polaribacter pacificus TaxID=1775173 RepID=A0A917HXB2_9FLAO|nr:ribonuclease P protein component [Polaribacter pacificus]GGG93599.1 ribonuclease P protein component [Polaribacter pacificus]